MAIGQSQRVPLDGGSAAARSAGVIGHSRGSPWSCKAPSLLTLGSPQNQRVQSQLSRHIISFAATPIVCDRSVSIQSLTTVFPTLTAAQAQRGGNAAASVDLPPRSGLAGLCPVELC